MGKLLVIISIMIVSLTSCVNNNMCIQTIQSRFPDGEVTHLEDTRYFLVIDSVGVYVVQCSQPFSADIYRCILVRKFQNR